MSKPIAVIGAGAIGLTSAYYLRRTGADVIVIENDRPGAGASHGNAGWIVPSLSAPLAAPGMARTALRAFASRNGPLRIDPTALPALLPWLLRFQRNCTASRHLAGMRATAALASDAVHLYEELRGDGIEFDMVEGGLVAVFPDRDKAQRHLHSLEPLAGYGYTGFDLLDEDALHRLEPGLGPRALAGFAVGQEAAVHPGSLIAGLVARLTEMDVPIISGTRVAGFRTENRVVTSVSTAKGEIDVSAVLIAAGAWSGQLGAQLGVNLRLQPGKGYSASVHSDRAPRIAVYAPEAKLGITPFGDRVRIAGGMELGGYGLELQPRRIEALLTSAHGILQDWRIDSESESWCGLRPMTSDGLPLIGALGTRANAYIAGGHAMLGITLAPATGRAVADLITTGRSPEVIRPFDPARRTL